MTTEHKYKTGDIVLRHSQNGPQYHFFAEVIKYLNVNKVLIRPIVLYNGGNIDTIGTDINGNIAVPEYSLSIGKHALSRKINSMQEQLKELKQLRKRIRKGE